MALKLNSVPQNFATSYVDVTIKHYLYCILVYNKNMEQHQKQKLPGMHSERHLPFRVNLW